MLNVIHQTNNMETKITQTKQEAFDRLDALLNEESKPVDSQQLDLSAG